MAPVIRDRILGLKPVSVGQLRGFSGGNPKKRTDEDREHLGESLENHGYVLPIAVRDLGDGTFEIIDGHGRLEQIEERDPNAQIKVLVLDVDSVAEGRRILLALQRTANFDMSALEKFVVDGLAEGTAMSALMADTGMTGKQLGAFAAAGQKALGELGDGGDDDDDGDKDPAPSRRGLNPEQVQFAATITRKQSKLVSEAMSLAKKLESCDAKGDALAAVCAQYLDRNRSAGKKSAASSSSKPKKKPAKT